MSKAQKKIFQVQNFNICILHQPNSIIYYKNKFKRYNDETKTRIFKRRIYNRNLVPQFFESKIKIWKKSRTRQFLL